MTLQKLHKRMYRFNMFILALCIALNTLSVLALSTNAVQVPDTDADRIYGANRYETAFAVADAFLDNLGAEKLPAVIVASGLDFADALAGSYLAVVKNAPILLFKSNQSTSVQKYIRQNLAPGGKVYILGGDKAVSTSFEVGLTGFQVKRLAGATRFETNLEILKEAGVSNSEILVCTGYDFADSLSASAVGKPILLVNTKKGHLTETQKDFLSETSIRKLYILGGPVAVSTKLETQLNTYSQTERIGGNTRYDTSILVAEKFFSNPQAAVLTYALTYPDGLCGGLLAHQLNAPMILSRNQNSSIAGTYTQKANITSGVVLGGPGLISDDTVRHIFGTLPNINKPTESTPEELLQAINGYYWYLDGYEYTYIHPNIIPWYDHACLDWESKNIYISSDSLVAYENFTPAEYWKYENDLSASSETHNTLLVNPIEYADSLISDFNMYVSSKKLYMTVGGTQYSFTRYSSPKQVDHSLKLGFTEATVAVGERVFLPVEVSPFWENYEIEVVEDAQEDFSTAYHDGWHGSGAYSDDGTTTLVFYAQSAGARTFTIRIKGTEKQATFKITVEAAPPINATGITLDKSSIELQRGETATIVANILPDDATEKGVIWTSGDESVATVSSSGTVTAVGVGTATITATSTDGGYTAICTVTVTAPPLTVDASIGIGMYISNSGMVRGVYVNADANGGSEEYIKYYIKVYFNGELVAEAEKDQIIVTLANGTYTAEVYVKDSWGNEVQSINSMTISGY